MLLTLGSEPDRDAVGTAISRSRRWFNNSPRECFFLAPKTRALMRPGRGGLEDGPMGKGSKLYQASVNGGPQGSLVYSCTNATRAELSRWLGHVWMKVVAVSDL